MSTWPSRIWLTNHDTNSLKPGLLTSFKCVWLVGAVYINFAKPGFTEHRWMCARLGGAVCVNVIKLGFAEYRLKCGRLVGVDGWLVQSACCRSVQEDSRYSTPELHWGFHVPEILRVPLFSFCVGFRSLAPLQIFLLSVQTIWFPASTTAFLFLFCCCCFLLLYFCFWEKAKHDLLFPLTWPSRLHLKGLEWKKV